jgi:hypothetical protein
VALEATNTRQRPLYTAILMTLAKRVDDRERINGSGRP